MQAARAWKQAEEAGELAGKTGRPAAVSNRAARALISDPERYFSKLLGAGQKSTQQAKALLDDAPNLAVRRGYREQGLRENGRFKRGSER